MNLVILIILIGFFEYLTGKCLGILMAPIFGYLVNLIKQLI